MRLSFDVDGFARDIGLSPTAVTTYFELLLGEARKRNASAPRVNEGIFTSAHQRGIVAEFALKHIRVIKEG